jgi:hypothetical protein
MKICLGTWFGLPQFFCTQGGREFFALLCHFSPLMFALAVKSRSPNAKVLIPFLNMVDLQDFFLLLLDDNLIKNFWGRDSCDDERYRCSGRSSLTWTWIMIFFWTGSLATIHTIFGLRNIFENSSQCRCSCPVGKQFVSLRRPLREALCHLFLLDIPFLVLRFWCSLQFDIVASTLLLKNASGIILSCAEIFNGSQPCMLSVYAYLGGIDEEDEE